LTFQLKCKQVMRRLLKTEKTIFEEMNKNI
jgi:hypothetical protein